jgi:purine-nucleoside phosphorylase
MSIHIGAEPGAIAETILLPGDPMRAKYVAETFLDEVVCYNEVRGMLGFTGMYQGKRVSVQGTGMGIPSISIYVNELITSYGVKNLVRIGTCGALQPDLKLRDVILAMTACTDSSFNKIKFNGLDYCPTASFKLLKQAYDTAAKRGIEAHVGSIISSDTFYSDDPDYWKIWMAYGILAVEMEAAALYTLAARFKVNALAIMTVSDSLVTEAAESSEAREKSYTQMIEIALGLAG